MSDTEVLGRGTKQDRTREVGDVYAPTRLERERCFDMDVLEAVYPIVHAMLAIEQSVHPHITRRNSPSALLYRPFEGVLWSSRYKGAVR